jgi:hypothetical protein
MDELTRERVTRVAIRSELKGKISTLNSIIEDLTKEVSTARNQKSILEQDKVVL